MMLQSDYPPLFDAPARGNPPEFLDETYAAKTRGMGLLYGRPVSDSPTVFSLARRQISLAFHAERAEREKRV